MPAPKLNVRILQPSDPRSHLDSPHHVLQSALHDHELVPDEDLSVCLDHAHMGVGGDDSWSRTVYHEYRVRAGTYSWAVGVRPISSTDDEDTVAQQAVLAAPASVRRREAGTELRPSTPGGGDETRRTV
jgi:hypothetical protein